MAQWVGDLVRGGVAQVLQVDDVLYDAVSPYQHIQVAVSPLFGRMLILDDAVQTTERDEHIYHEMLAHLPLVTHPGPRRVLIIGGGDGGTLEEVLKHPVEQATMVEIDRAVVDVSRTYLPGIAGAAFDDPRARLLIADGIAFVRETDDRFDVILVDSTDPKGAAEALFADAFFRLCAHVLTPDGLLCMQSGSLSYQRDLAAGARTVLSEIFPVALPYWAAIPTYPGTLWTFTLGSRRADPRRVDREAIARRTAGFDLRYYGPDVHHAALAMPALP
jgi:spermidine synthase